jgi:5-methylcytosine-specific restriction endonuclease McrA
MLTGRAETVTDYSNLSIRSSHDSFRLPKILRLFSLHQAKKHVKFCRFNVLHRDDFKCQYCLGKFSLKDLTLDHVIPTSRGGKNTWDNVVTACSKCNGKKGNRLPKEAGMKLHKVPKRPSWSPQIILKLKEDDPDEWWDWFQLKKSVA